MIGAALIANSATLCWPQLNIRDFFLIAVSLHSVSVGVVRCMPKQRNTSFNTYEYVYRGGP